MDAASDRIDAEVSAAMRHRDRRFFAAVVDLGILPNVAVGWTYGLDDESLLRGASIAVLALLYVLLETTTGRTPGKFLLDLMTTGTDGNRVTVRGALIRRMSWMAPWAIGYAVGNGIGEVIGFAIIISVVWTTGRDPQFRGWHDHAADTVVVAAPERASPPAKGAAVLGIVLTAVAASLLSST